MESLNTIPSSLRDRVDYSLAFNDVTTQGDYANGDLIHNLGKEIQQSLDTESFSFPSHRLIKPGDLGVTTCHAETCPSELQGEWCPLRAQTHDAGRDRHRLLRPCDITNLLGSDAYSLVTSSSEEDSCSASSHTVEIIVPRMGLLKPSDFIPSRSSEYSSMSSSPQEDRLLVSSQTITVSSKRRVCLLRPCDISLGTSQDSPSSQSTQEQDWFSVSSHTKIIQVCLLRPCDISIIASENPASSSEFEVGQERYSASSLTKGTSLPLLRPRDILTSGPQNVSSVRPALSQANIYLPRKLHLVKPRDLAESIGITFHEVHCSSSRSEISLPTSIYFSASTHLPDSFHDSVYSSATSSLGHEECSVTKEVSPLPVRYLHRTASYSCRSSGSWDKSTSWSSSVSSGFSSVSYRYPDLVDQTLASISLPTTTSTVRSLDDLTSWNPSSLGGYELGRGVHGAVHLYRHKQTGQPVAVKVLSLPKDYTKRHASICEFKKEVHFQELVSNSPYYPALYGVIRLDEDRVGLAMEFVGDGVTGKSITLYRALEVGQQELTRQQILLIAVDVVEGLRELHDKGMLINDLKNDNILIRKEFGKWRGVLIDLGQACTIQQPISYHFSQREKHEYLTIGRYRHIAPELALSERPSTVASDVFQIGAVFIELGQTFHINELYQLGCICCVIASSERPSLDEVVECLGAIMRKYYQCQDCQG